MITTIRSQLKQSTYRYVVFFLVSVIALSMISSLFVKNERRDRSSWALRVNGAEISYQDFAREVAKQSEYLAHIKAQYGQYADLLFQSLGWSFDPKSRALDILTKEELINQFGKKMGLTLHPEYVNTMLNNAQFVKQNLGLIVPEFVFDKAGVLDMNLVKLFLQQTKTTAQQFENAIEKSLIQYQVLNHIAASSYIPVFDIQQYFIAKYLNKQFSYLTFSFDHYITEEKKKHVTDEEMRAFYDLQNVQLRRYWMPEKRNGIMFTFKPEHYNIVISDEEIQGYYEDNKMKSYVLDPLKIEVQQIIVDQVAQKTNKSIKEVEQELSTNSSSVYEKYWTTVKPFGRGEHKGEYEKNAFVLQNPGEMSSSFETNEGTIVLRLVKRIARTYKPLASVKKDIENILINKAFKKQFVKDIKNTVLKDNSQSMELFVKEKSATQESISNIFKDDTQLSLQLFSLKKNHYGFFVENGVGKAVMLTDIVERHLPDLVSVKDIVKNDLYETRAREALKDDAIKADKKAETESFESLKLLFNSPLTHIESFNSNDNKKIQELSKKGLPVHDMINMEKEGSVMLFHGDRNSFLIKLDTIENFDQERLLSVEKEVYDNLGPIRTRLLLDSTIASLHRNATIETNESILVTNEEYSE